ncbi:hypothetical protein BH11GEM2_BH11GEM2_28100 [soil metagenome]
MPYTRQDPGGFVRLATARPLTAGMALLVTACSGADPADSYVRGRGLKVASLSADAESRIFGAAVGAAFDVTPDLSLRLHPRRLPRTAGDSGGAPAQATLVRALRDRGVIIGTCEPKRDTPRDKPRCAGPEAGYIIRASDVFAMAGDTLEVYFAAETYGAATGRKPDALRFERIYKLVKRGESWRVAREAPVRQR